MKEAVGYMVSGKGSITVVVGSKTYNVDVDHTNYKAILESLRNKSYEKIMDLMDVGHSIVTHSKGKFRVENGFIYNGEFIVDNSLTRRILEFIKNDYPFEPMLKFLENILQNPSARAIGELYTFLEVNTLPITEDGYFLAYKRVREDYMDIYSGTILNTIGTKVSMERQKVVEDKSQTCAAGYHACSLGYLSQFYKGEGHIMILKINPADVVSIPIDYNNSKLRCCEYTVVGEHVIDKSKEEIPDKFDKPLYSGDGSDFEAEECNDSKDDDTVVDDWDDCARCTDTRCSINTNTNIKRTEKLGVKPDGSKFWNVRDKSGKFSRK